jgi:taurine dioxygenase
MTSPAITSLEGVKTRLDHLEVVYMMKPRTVPNFRFLPRQNIRVVRSNPFQEGLDQKIEGGAYPPVVHPPIFTRRETGRKLLNLSPLFADSILGMDRAEGDDLLRWLANHITVKARAYDHDWQEGDMVL